MVEGYDIRKAGQLASVVASFAVEKHGTQEHRFGWSEIKGRYYKSYREKI
jgi:sugar/nucleoside kinase (ribokinase family)